MDFNSGWTFCKQGSAPISVCLPHDAMLHEPRSAKSGNGVQSGFFPGGIYTYEKKFSLNAEHVGKPIKLLFEGVYRNATVWFNGKKAAFHAYGYTEFYVDITNLVSTRENTLRLEVDNSLVPNCRWYSGAGIYRPVALIIREKRHISNLIIKTLSHSPPTIEVSAQCDLPLEVEIYDGDTTIARGGIGRFELSGAQLWDEHNPKLYTCKASCKGDSISVRFGIRSLEWSAEKGLLINGERTLLRGGCIHHDNGVLGACGFTDAEYRRVKILKEQGFNALRISHNPASRALLDACDELGIYVMDECFDGWYTPKEYHDYSRQFFDGYLDDLSAMVKKDINHPCVIMYSIGNEVTETTEQKGIRLCAKMRDHIKSIDDTRPVTCGINVLLNVYAAMGLGVYKDNKVYKPRTLPEKNRYRDKKSGSAFFNAMTNKLRGMFFLVSKLPAAEKITSKIASSLDVVGLNYASSRYDPDVKKYPDRLMLGAETMVADLPYNWVRVQKYPQLLGDFVWSAWDYLGEACIGDWTYHSYKGLPLLAGQGMIDITGKPLASMAFIQVVWGLQKKPFIAVSPLNHSGKTPSSGAWQFTNAIDSWSWQGYEGNKTMAEIFANADAVRLELNGKNVGTRKVKNFRAVFALNYTPGELAAVALDETGRELSRSSLKTGGDKTILTLKADKTVLSANNQDLCHVEIEFTDENGTLKPFVEQRVDIAVSGSAFLAGFGSALCKTDEVFDKTYHHSYRGRCLAVLRAGAKPGMTEITVSSAGVEAEKLAIEVR